MTVIYRSLKEKEHDIILVNSTKALSCNSAGNLREPSSLERLTFAYDKAAATVRLAMDKCLQKTRDL